MTAYVILIRDRTKDPQNLAAYHNALLSAAASEPLSILACGDLACGGNQEVLEGGPTEEVILLSFPDGDSARQWYSGESAKSHRLQGADYRVIFAQSSGGKSTFNEHLAFQKHLADGG